MILLVYNWKRKAQTNDRNTVQGVTETCDLFEKAPFLYKGSDGLGKENGRRE